MATFYLLSQERHGHEELLVGIVPKYNAQPFLAEETFERPVDLIQVAHTPHTPVRPAVASPMVCIDRLNPHQR